MDRTETVRQPMIVVIDDDVSVCEALEGLFKSIHLSVACFTSVGNYLDAPRSREPDCIILDVRMPGRSSLDFFDQFVRGGVDTSVIFMSGYADVAMVVRAMKAGATDFLSKPFRDQDMLDAAQAAIIESQKRQSRRRSQTLVAERTRSLTSREREVMEFVVLGRRNKQIAIDLGLSEATVKLHRGLVMKKMRADSLADLVRMVGDADVPAGWLD